MQTVIRQKLTEAGVLGVILMIVGPAVIGFASLSIASTRRTAVGIPDITWLYGVAIAGAIITMLSLPLIIVGRRYIVEKSDQ